MSGSIHRLSRENGEDVWREAGSVAPLFPSVSLSPFFWVEKLSFA